MPKNNQSSLQANPRLLLHHLPQMPSVAIIVMVKTGSRYEAKRISGISHFLEHMVFKGTTKRPTSLDITGEIDGIGGEFNAFTSKEYTGFFIKAAAKDAELIIEVIADMLNNSTFAPEEIDRERGVIIEEMSMYLDSPQHLVADIYDHVLYPGHPLGQDVIGTKESLSNINRQELVDYLSQWYKPNNLVVSVSGNFNPERIADLAHQYFFNTTEQRLSEPVPVTVSQNSPGVIAYQKDTDQTHLILGVRACSYFDEQRFPLLVLNTILGGNMSSRLFNEVREKRGLAYAVHTGIDHFADAGSFDCQVGLDHNRVEEAIKVILEQFKLIADQPVNSLELTRAKNYIRGKLSLSLEDPLGYGLFTAKQQLLQGATTTPEDYLAKVDKVTIEQVQHVAQQIFVSDKLNVAIVCPQPDEAKLQSLLTL